MTQPGPLPAAGPRPGPHRPVPATPPRAPGSVRRTTSIDVTRPDGLLGRLVVDARGQDVRTGADGLGHVVDRIALTVEIDQGDGTVVALTAHDVGRAPRQGDATGERSLETGRGGPLPTTSRGSALDGLVGANVRKGFGRRLAEALPEERERRSLLYSLLDDLGGAVLVSGYAPLRAGLMRATPEQAAQWADVQADVCTGWARGGPLLEALRRTGSSPVPVGPTAPVIEGDDPLGWHPLPALATETVRRRRRLDVAPSDPAGPGEPGEPGALGAQSHFRDSYAGDDGEMVMHEYLIDTRLDDQRRLARVDVDARVLPWSECPGAVASAQRLVGTPAGEIPARVRADLAGPSTCTHLNSTLRCLADLPALIALLP